MHVEELEKFLKTLDLKAYRDTYRPVKLVEMDLPKDIQAVALTYKIYWNEKRFINYDDFYNEYAMTYEAGIENFRQKITMCEDCFYRGLPARIYRTWASIITQIHAGYVAEAVFGPGSVAMSAELDHNGADFQVNYKGRLLNYQVKKTTYSREVRKAKVSKRQIPGRSIDIAYDVPSEDYFVNPRKLDGEFKAPYVRFIENKELKRFPNGFVVFTTARFDVDKKAIDKAAKII